MPTQTSKRNGSSQKSSSEKVVSRASLRRPMRNDRNLWIPGGRTFPDDDLYTNRILIKSSAPTLAGRYARAHDSGLRRRLQRDRPGSRRGPLVARRDRPRRPTADARRSPDRKSVV